MNNLLVSIIIPIYNVESYIERCARSLYEQSYTNVEYIWVNDATPDNSIEVLRNVSLEYSHRISNVHIIEHDYNKGLPSARNTGISVARGKYILHCDSDDWADKNMVEELVACAESTQSDLVWCDFYSSYSNKDILIKQNKDASREACLSNLLSQKMHGGYWNKLILRKLYLENQIIFSAEASMCEDLLGTLQLFYYAKKVSYCPMAFYHYVQDNSSAMSVNFSPKKLSDIKTNIDTIIDFFDNEGIEDQYSVEINYLKLLVKRSLLMTTDISYFRQWRGIYPESNSYILSYTVLPLIHRLLGWFSYKRLWLPIFIWIWIKKLKNINLL